VIARPGWGLRVAVERGTAMAARMYRSGSIVAVLATLVATIGVAGSVGPAAAATYTPVGTVTEFTAGITQVSGPQAIAAGPDGDMWFPEPKVGQIARITPTGKVTEFSKGITPGGDPYGIAAGPDGNMWFTEMQAGRVGQITPTGKVTEQDIGITPNSWPTSIAEGPDGDMWFTESLASQIGRITPTGKVTEFSKGITGFGLGAIVAGADGNMWFADAGAGIGRITPTGKVTQFSAGITGGVGQLVDGIAAGPDGNIWFTDGDQVGRITMTGKVTEFGTGIPPGTDTAGIAAGPDANMWFTETGLQDEVGRIGTGVSSVVGTVTEFSAGITANSRPAGIAAGPDGNMWFTEPTDGDPGRITKIGRITTGVPSAPRTVTASPRSRSAVVSWVAPTNPGTATIKGYRVTATPGAHHCVSTSTRGCTVLGLKNGTRYRFSVTAHNVAGPGPASARSAAVIVGTPTAPRALKVTFPHAGSARVTWRAPAFHGSTAISSYQVRWSSNGGRTWSAWAGTKRHRNARRTGLHKNKTYLVQVRARNRSGAGLVAILTFTQPH
jgi:virginiamycin B lyase